MKRISSLVNKVKDNNPPSSSNNKGPSSSSAHSHSSSTSSNLQPTSPNSANPPGGHAQTYFSGQYAPPAGPPPKQQGQPQTAAYPPPSSHQGGGYPPPSASGYPPPSAGGYPPPAGPPGQGAGGYPPPAGGPPQGFAQNVGGFAAPSGPPPGHSGGLGAGLAGRENELAQLKRYDTVILVDDSESMEMFWDETRDALMGVVEVASKYDSDGLDLYFFNSTRVAQGVTDATSIRSLFRQVEPRRSTPTLNALSRVLLPYVDNLEKTRRAKPLNLICLTDGAPDRGQDPESVIVDVAKRLDAGRFPPYQVGLQFIQIGVDDEATVALKNLDDGLKTKHGVRDFVDVTPFEAGPDGQPAKAMTAEYMLKVMLGGISRKYDNQG